MLTLRRKWNLYEFCVGNECNTCLHHYVFSVGCEVRLVSSSFSNRGYKHFESTHIEPCILNTPVFMI